MNTLVIQHQLAEVGREIAVLENEATRFSMDHEDPAFLNGRQAEIGKQLAMLYARRTSLGQVAITIAY